MMFQKMVGGFAWEVGEINTSSVEVLELLIKEEMEQKAVNEIPSKAPQYILNLWQRPSTNYPMLHPFFSNRRAKLNRLR